MARTSRKQGSPLRGYHDAIRQEEGNAAGQLKTPAVEAGGYERLSYEDKGWRRTKWTRKQDEVFFGRASNKLTQPPKKEEEEYGVFFL